MMTKHFSRIITLAFQCISDEKGDKEREKKNVNNFGFAHKKMVLLHLCHAKARALLSS